MRDLPVLTAARLSASFPYVTPAAVLPERFGKGVRRRVVDAGYYDNYGINVICGWLDEYTTRPEKMKWLLDHRGIVVIEIRDGIDSRFGPVVTWMTRAKTTPLSRGLEGFLSPPSAVLAARESVPIFRNDEQIEGLSRRFPAGFFTTAKFEFTEDASLSWYLTSEERKALDDDSGAGHNQIELEGLKRWWTSLPPPGSHRSPSH
jgi:hypothetical protein